jgi:hypothetical protein
MGQTLATTNLALQETHHIIHRLLSNTSPGWPKARSPLRKEAIARCVTMNLR